MNSEDQTVIVIDDDHRIREALSSLISSAGFRVAAYASAADFAGSEMPDVPSCIVLDLQLPDMNGLDMQRELAELQGPPIVFITGYGDIPSSVQAMKAGAIDFLPKPFEEQKLLNAIDAAIAKDREVRKQRLQIVELTKSYSRLTRREREVLPYVVAGHANKQTAAELGIAEITVGVHRGQIMRKMNARSLAELIRMADALALPPAQKYS
jgi:FixJ family two-component response regulator